MCKSSEFNAVYDEGTNMYVAVGQFAVTPDWHQNARTCVELMMQGLAERRVAVGSPRGAAGQGR